jgi:hypothetical protein
VAQGRARDKLHVFNRGVEAVLQKGAHFGAQR